MIKKLKNKKIALIGTSPIMLIIANHLVKLNNKVIIYSFNKKVVRGLIINIKIIL